MGKRHWRLLALLLAAILFSGSFAGCRTRTIEEEATPTPIPTAVVPTKPTYKVERGTVVEELKFTGRIAPVEEEQLFFRVDGRVAKVNVKQGDKVKKGDVLAELEITDLLNALAQAKVALETAQLQLKTATEKAGGDRARLEIELQLARLRLAQAKVQDPTPNVAIAKYQVEQAKDSLWSVQIQRDASCGDGKSSDCNSAQASVQAAEDSLRIAQAQYDLALQDQQTHQYDLQILEQDVRLAELDLQKGGGSVDPTLTQEVARAQLEVDRLNGQVADARLTATIDGEVTMVGAYAGRTVTAYRPAVSVAAPGALEISADLTSETMQKLSIGQKATISIVNYPAQEFHGTIRRLPYPYGTGGSSTASPMEEDRSTRVSIDDANVTLEKGSLVRVSVVLQKKDNVLWLPPAAIRTFQGKDFVLVLDGEGQRRMPVKVGIKAEDRVEILSGVDEGQVVVGP